MGKVYTKSFSGKTHLVVLRLGWGFDKSVRSASENGGGGVGKE